MVEKRKPVKEPRFCPYCDVEIAEAAFPYCEACKIDSFVCPECGQTVPREKEVCPHCGTDIKEEAAGEG